jgi:putative addiction module antidote
MIELRIQRVGTSVGVILPKEALDALGIEGTDGEILTLAPQPDGRVELRRVDTKWERKLALLRDTMKKYENALRDLAK